MPRMASFLEFEVQGTKYTCCDSLKCRALLRTVSCFKPLKSQVGQRKLLCSIHLKLVTCLLSLEWSETDLGVEFMSDFSTIL